MHSNCQLAVQERFPPPKVSRHHQFSHFRLRECHLSINLWIWDLIIYCWLFFCVVHALMIWLILLNFLVIFSLRLLIDSPVCYPHFQTFESANLHLYLNLNVEFVHAGAHLVSLGYLSYENIIFTWGKSYGLDGNRVLLSFYIDWIWFLFDFLAGMFLTGVINFGGVLFE